MVNQCCGAAMAGDGNGKMYCLRHAVDRIIHLEGRGTTAAAFDDWRASQARAHAPASHDSPSGPFAKVDPKLFDPILPSEDEIALAERRGLAQKRLDIALKNLKP